MLSLPHEPNWGNNVNNIAQIYNIDTGEDYIKGIKKATFSMMVKKAVIKVAFHSLTMECGSKKKTKELKYTVLKMQSYFKQLFPYESRLIFKTRAKILDIKEHMPFKYKDRLCRRCKLVDENLDHIINCSNESDNVIEVDISSENIGINYTQQVARKINTFLLTIK